MRNIIKLIATFFYIGYCPIMPGTAGSLAGAAIFLLVRGNKILQIVIFALLFVAGCLVSGETEKFYGNKDDKRIVIDEVCGILLLYLLIPSYASYLIIGFLIYRLLDVWKPFAIKKLQELNGSLGIMADDILAAIYSFLVIQILFCLKICLV